MPGPVFLDGDPVSLHPIEGDDVDFLCRWANHPEVRVDSGIQGPVTREMRESQIEAIDESDDVQLLVCVDAEPVGTVGFKDVDERQGTAELAYWTAPDHRSNGYATEAAGLLLDYGFEERRLHKVSAEVFAHNEGSIHLLEKLGFEREGVHREEVFVDGERVDVHRYGMLADEWRE